MFVFTLGEKYKAKGLSSDAIAPNMRNRFNFLCEEAMLHDRLQVRFAEKAVRFFFYDIDKADDGKGIVVEEHYKEVASISLTNRKETGHDILYLKNQIEAKLHEISCLKNSDLTLWKNACKKMVSFDDEKGTAFDDFPFVRQWNWKQDEMVEWFTFFIQCCFLDFIMDLEDRESSFSVSPYYDEVRDKLRECKVYQLLCAKVKYAMYLYCGEDAFSKDEYTFKTQKYADLLMDANINKIIPPYYYFDQLWFYNPEEELDIIERKNYEANRQSGGVRLDAKIQNKIRDYFFRHHAAISAMGSHLNKTIYCVYIGIIGLFSVVATYSMIMFDKNNSVVNCFFENIWFWDVLGLVSLICLAVLTISRSVNVFMPRVLVALGIGWLTAFISEDLVKSQLEIGPVFTTCSCIGVLVLITLLLFGEARQHSPYYLNGNKGLAHHFSRQIGHFSSSWKLLPILVHSYFWALTLGTVMQFAVYDDLLKNSRALQEVVFEDDFMKAQNYVMHLSYMKDALVDYQSDLDRLFFKAGVSGVIKGADGTNFMVAKMDYDTTELLKIQKRSQAKVLHIYEKYANVDSVVKQTMIANGRYRFVSGKDQGQGFAKWIVFGQKPFQEIVTEMQQLSFLVDSIPYASSSTKFDDLVSQQLKHLDRLIATTEEEIQSVRIFVSENDNHDSLIEWSYLAPSRVEGPCTMQQLLKNGAMERHNLCRKVKMLWFLDLSEIFVEKIIFPRMLIFHSLIVLIIAFVGQLIVSDKSVTEPL